MAATIATIAMGGGRDLTAVSSISTQAREISLCCLLGCASQSKACGGVLLLIPGKST